MDNSCLVIPIPILQEQYPLITMNERHTLSCLDIKHALHHLISNLQRLDICGVSMCIEQHLRHLLAKVDIRWLNHSVALSGYPSSKWFMSVDLLYMGLDTLRVLGGQDNSVLFKPIGIHIGNIVCSILYFGRKRL